MMPPVLVQAHIDAAKTLLLSSLESKRDTYHAPATPLVPKLSPAELQLERQLENLGRCNRPAEAAGLQREVARNRLAAAERLARAQAKAFDLKVRMALPHMSRCNCHRTSLHSLIPTIKQPTSTLFHWV